MGGQNDDWEEPNYLAFVKMCRLGSKRLLVALHKRHPEHMAAALRAGRLVVYP